MSPFAMDDYFGFVFSVQYDANFIFVLVPRFVTDIACMILPGVVFSRAYEYFLFNSAFSIFVKCQ
jgi:uncharacterized sodium:solute symporter family permease YidK